MTLSEAIRLGAMLGPQAHGRLTTMRRRWFGLFGPLETHSYCALGGAFQAATGGRSKSQTNTENAIGFRGVGIKAGTVTTVMETPAEWPMHKWATCPECQAVSMPIHRLIPHLNDDHKRTREQIADFIETIEVMAPERAYVPVTVVCR